jgi:hypothetical protein
MSHSTTQRNRHSHMARPTRRTKQTILIPVAGNELRPLADAGLVNGRWETSYEADDRGLSDQVLTAQLTV